MSQNMSPKITEKALNTFAFNENLPSNFSRTTIFLHENTFIYQISHFQGQR